MKITKIHPSQIPKKLMLTITGLWVLELGDPPLEERFYGYHTKKDVEQSLKINNK